MLLRAGTSGFSYTAWRGSFYPDRLPASDMLRYYADRLPTVEINNTYYRMPNESVLADWRDIVPDGFTFVLKVPRWLTHSKNVLEVAERIGHFFTTASALGDKLGPVLVQLAPNVKKDRERITHFLSAAPRGARVAFDFHHPSWFADDIFDVLREHESALCAAHADDRASPLITTTSWGYLRLRNGVYSDAELDEWVAKARAQSWQELYVFFKHDDAATGPRLAERFHERFAD